MNREKKQTKQQEGVRGVDGDKARGGVKLGLALGGGALAGVAHIGVLEVLEERGITPDIIAGTSAGAFVGAAYASGGSAKRLHQEAYRLSWKVLRRRILPRMALASAGPMRVYLKRMLGVSRFEDLKIPLAVVATDLVSAEMVVMTAEGMKPKTGSIPEDVVVMTADLIDAITASCAIPVVFEPVKLDGRLLVDGFLTNNVPAGLARMLGAQRVIAVDLMSDHRRRPPPRHIIEYALSALNTYRYWSVKNRSIWADVVLRPNVAELRQGDAIDVEGLVEAGRQACLKALPAIEKMLSEPAGVGGGGDDR